jgi:nucleoside-diphosphate-sugar epimerase
MVLGPTIPHYPLPASIAHLSTIQTIYALISSRSDSDTYPEGVPVGWMVDVRDLAKAHVDALSIPPLENGRNKRFILSSKQYQWDDVVRVIRNARPELSHRLPSENAIPPPTFPAPLDVSFADEVLKPEYIPWEQTVLDCLDAGLRWEQQQGQK